MANETRAERRCHACGSGMVRDTRPMTFEYKGHSIALQQPGWYCIECEEGVAEGADMKATALDFMAFRAKIDGVLGPDEVRAIRQSLGLSQRKAGETLGGGARSFQMYENGSRAVSQAMSNLLRLLRKDPALLHDLRGEQERASA